MRRSGEWRVTSDESHKKKRLNNWDNRIEPASHLVEWWDWEFLWPRYEDYRSLVRARNGNHYAAGPPRSG